MSLVLNSTSGGSVTIAEPATASNFTQTLAAADGTLAPLVSGTAVTASGTAVNFTGIPAYAKRITVMFSGVSTNGTSQVLARIGSGSIVSSGYLGMLQGFTGSSVGAVTLTDGFRVENTGSAASLRDGSIVLTNITGNIWVANGNVQATGSGGIGGLLTGSITLSGTLDRVSITTVGGANTFDAGTINIMWE